MQTVYKAPEWTPHVAETLHTERELDRLDHTDTDAWVRGFLELAEATIVVTGIALVALALALMVVV